MVVWRVQGEQQDSRHSGAGATSVAMTNASTPDPVDLLVGARIRLRRKMLGLSQSALADALGLTFQQVQKYEKGTNRVSASKLSQIAKKLECTVAHLHAEEPGAAAPGENVIGLGTPGAAEMLALFAQLSPALRRALLDLIRAQVRQP